MIEFFHDLPYSGLLWTGLLAGLLASLACGVIGPYVITRRIVFLSGAIAHMAVGGAGAALFVKTMFPGVFAWVEPIHGATLAALGAAVLIGFVHQRVNERMDTLIGAVVGRYGGGDPADPVHARLPTGTDELSIRKHRGSSLDGRLADARPRRGDRGRGTAVS